MPPLVATFFCFLGIAGLFVLDRDRNAKTSPALWLSVAWLAINGSRAVSQWLQPFGLGGGSIDSPEQRLEGSPLDRFVYFALTLLAIAVLCQHHRKIGAVLRANWPIVLFFTYCAISTLWSEYPSVAFKRWVKAIGDISMVFVILTDTNCVAAIKRVFSRVGFVLLPLSILFIKYYPELGRGYSPEGAVGYQGVTTSKNQLGMITLLLGIGLTWSLIQAFRHLNGKQKTRTIVAHLATLSMVAWLLWIADSATSTYCFILATILMLITSLSRHGRKPVVVYLLSASVLTLVLVAMFFDTGGTLLGSVGRDTTLTGRTDIWKLALGMSGNPIFGTGFESFWIGERLQKVWKIYRFHLNEAHNGYIEVYLELGWLGITLLGLLIVTGFRNVLAEFRRGSEIASLKFAFLVVAVIYNLTESGFRILDPVWIFFFFGIAASLDSSQIKAPVKVSAHRDKDARVQKLRYAKVLGSGYPRQTT